MAELVTALVKAARAYQIYESNNPVHRRFVHAVQAAFAAALSRVSQVTLTVDGDGFRYGERAFPTGEGRDALSYLFYRDGVRSLTFLPGFEAEVVPFLDLIKDARLADREGDDLITLLWQRDFASLRYAYHDQLAQGILIPEEEAGSIQQVDPREIRRDMEEPPGGPGEEAEDGSVKEASSRAGTLDPRTFQETLFFLSEPELEALRAEVELEWSRDVRADVLNALFDRVEDGATEDRQLEVLGILQELVPLFLAQGHFAPVSRILGEVAGFLRSSELLTPAAHQAAEEVVSRISDAEGLGQLLQALNEGFLSPSTDELGTFFGALQAPALPILLRAGEGEGPPEIRALLQGAVIRIAREHERSLQPLLESDDPLVARGAARVAGHIGFAPAAPQVVRLLRSGDAPTRLVAVEALARIPSRAALEALPVALQDVSREVRIAAARGIAETRFEPARAALEERVGGRDLADADLTEKIAVFEAFAAVTGASGVGLLDRLLNGRSLLGRRRSSEVRACAARALAMVQVAAARDALRRSEGDDDPLVRSAVGRALGGGTG